MKKIGWIVLIVLVVLGVALVWFLNQAGMFAKIEVKEMEIGPLALVYEKHVGDFSKVAAICDRLCKSLTEQKVAALRGFGIYFDNPKETKKENLRSISGCIVEETDSSKLPVLKEKFNLLKLPKSKTIAVEFPFQNKMAIMVGIMRVYPLLTKYIKEKALQIGPALEIYDMKAKKIIYAFPLENIKILNFEKIK